MAITNKSHQSYYSDRQWRWQELTLIFLLVYNTFAASVLYNVPAFWFFLFTLPLYFGLIIGWLIYLLRQKRLFPASLIDFLWVGLAGIFLLSTLVSIEPRLSLNDLPFYFTYLMVYYIAIERLRSGWPVTLFLKALMFTASVVSMIALLEYLAWYTLGIFGSGQGWWTIGGWSNPIPPSLYRLRFTLFNPNLVGVLLALVLPTWLAVAIITRSQSIRWVMIVGAGFLGMVILLTFSRSALLGLVMGASVFGFLVFMKQQQFQWLRDRIFRRWWVGLAIGLPMLGLVLLIGQPVLRALNRPDSNQMRIELWGNTLQLIRDHPLLGTGPATFGMAIMNYWESGQIFFPFVQAHNLPLHLAAELGLPGLLLIGSMAFLVVRAGYQSYLQLPFKQAVLMAAVLAGLVTFAGQSVADSLVNVPAIMLPVMLLAAICSYRAETRLGVGLLKPGLFVAVAILIAGWAGWALYGLARFEKFLAAVQVEQWSRAADQLSQLPLGTLPSSFYQFQQGLVYGKLAEQHQLDHNDQIALTHYQAGLAETPIYLPGRANLAAVAWLAGNLTKAEQELRRAIDDAGPVYAQLLYRLNLGLLYEQQTDNHATIILYAEALSLEPILAASIYWQQTEWRRQNWETILAEAERQIEQIHEADQINLRRGELLYHSGNLAGAAALFQESPFPLKALWTGRVLVDQGRFEEALAPLNQVLATPEGQLWSEAYLYRGRAYLTLGKQDLAISDLKMALFLGSKQAYYDLGKHALSENEVGKSIFFLRQSLPNLANLYDLQKDYDFLVYRVAYSRPHDSVLLPLPVIPPSRNEVAMYLELADLYLQQKDNQAAREIYKQLLEFIPGYQPVLDKLETLGTRQ